MCRRTMMSMVLLVAVTMFSGLCIGAEKACTKANAKQQTCRHKAGLPDGWQLAMQSYSFKKFTFFEGIDKTAALGLKYIQGSGGRVISAEHPDIKFFQLIETDEKTMKVRREVKKKLQDSDVALISYGVVALPNDEAKCRKVFDFAKDMGIGSIVSEPPLDAYDLVEKLCKEYNIRVEIHNHARPGPKSKPKLRYWFPEMVLQVCNGRSEMIGTCADTGHWVRSGIDPVEAMKKLEGRIMSIHLKDVNVFGTREAHCVPWGTGEGKIKEILAELARQNFKGPIIIEYEYNWDNPMPDMKQSIEYFNKVAGEL